MARTLKLTGLDGSADYEHRVGGADVSIDKQFEFRQDGVPWLEIHRWTVNFALIKDSPTPLTTQISELENALRKEYLRAEILDNGVSTSTILGGSRLLGTVRPVKPPSYTKLQGGELITYRTGTYALEAVIKVYENSTDIISWQEQVSGNLTGETAAMLQPNVGDAVYQITRESQHSTLVQRGTITRAGEYGDVPDPIYDQTLVNNQLGPVKVTKLPPRRIGTPNNAAYVGFTQQYEYQFAASTDLDANPSTWD